MNTFNNRPGGLHKKSKNIKLHSLLNIGATIFIFIVLVVHMPKLTTNKQDTILVHSMYKSTEEALPPPSSCTAEQKLTIAKQLSPSNCTEGVGFLPYRQFCSITKATNCPNPNWLSDYYRQLKRRKDEEFTAVYVGCNKGFDAVNALRMGTGDAKYSKKEWGVQLQDHHRIVCKQDRKEFPISSYDLPINGHVHCIKPMPTNFNKLATSAKDLGWDDKLLVTQAAMSKENGVTYFMDALFGIENHGLASTSEC